MRAVADDDRQRKEHHMPVGALDGVRVLDVSTVVAGPMSATLLGDYGAHVIKVEHPRGDPQRNHGVSKEGEGLWWKSISRNKHCVTINLSTPEGQEQLLALVSESDVLIENFRPGVMERWNLGWDQLRQVNPGLVMLRVTGFGQFGPYASRPGFGTLAEAMSGFAQMTGEPDAPPTLPPFGLADGIAGIAGAYAVMLGLFHRDRPGGNGEGQFIDMSLIEPIFGILGPQPIVYDQTGAIPQRTGNRGSGNNAPRNTYRTKDDRWVAISTSVLSIAERCMITVGHPEVITEPWFARGETRAQRADLLDGMVGSWVAERTQADVLARMEEAGVAIAPVYDIADIMEDPQFTALGAIATVDDEVLGPLKMQNVMFRMSQTPGEIKWTGRALGADNDTFLKSPDSAE